jgi:ABC-type phosphate transport system auxiliary subunit
MEYSMMHERLNKMFKMTTDQDDVKKYAEHMFKKRNIKHIDDIKKKDELLSKNHERNIEDRLEKWRLKERKKDFHERINQLAIKENMPKTVI